MIEYAVINYAQIVYIRKQIHDLQGLDSNAAVSVFFRDKKHCMPISVVWKPRTTRCERHSAK